VRTYAFHITWVALESFSVMSTHGFIKADEEEDMAREARFGGFDCGIRL
jgi:hypothetical protein